MTISLYLNQPFLVGSSGRFFCPSGFTDTGPKQEGILYQIQGGLISHESFRAWITGAREVIMIPGYDGWGHLGQAYRTDQARSRSMDYSIGRYSAFDYGATGH